MKKDGFLFKYACTGVKILIQDLAGGIKSVVVEIKEFENTDVSKMIALLGKMWLPGIWRKAQSHQILYGVFWYV